MNENARCEVVGTMEGAFEMPNRVYSVNGCCPSLRTFQGGGIHPKILETVKIKQATKECYAEMKIGGVCDFSFTESETRRGRVQKGGDVCPTLTAQNNEICRIETKYRIRKLTPRECWRLMGFTDEDFDKAASVNSDTQLYKQAGNSIVVNCLEGIFSNLIS